MSTMPTKLYNTVREIKQVLTLRNKPLRAEKGRTSTVTTPRLGEGDPGELGNAHTWEGSQRRWYPLETLNLNTVDQ